MKMHYIDKSSKCLIQLKKRKWPAENPWLNQLNIGMNVVDHNIQI